VFNEYFNEAIKVDGVSYNVYSGVLLLPIHEGEHTISKDDVANLYFMVVDYGSGERGLTTKESVQVYPNPASDVLYISSFNKVTTMNLYSANGGLVKQYNGDMERIYLTGLQPGVYFLKINVGNKTSIKRVVKL
jgi:hypothetical protein